MSNELEEAKARIAQLEKSFADLHWALPPKPDPNLAEDEWHAIFSDWQNLDHGLLQKIPWLGGSNMTSTFVVKRWHPGLERQRNQLVEELVKCLEWYRDGHAMPEPPYTTGYARQEAIDILNKWYEYQKGK